jgi:hypothetical protein
LILGEVKSSYTREFCAAITAFRRCAFLLDVEESQLAAGSLDYAGFVAAGVVAMIWLSVLDLQSISPFRRCRWL